MRCFNHPERDAVALCKACGKAVCPDCAIESQNGFACQQSCTQTLIERHELHDKQAVHLRNIKRTNLLSSLFSISFGILFIYFSSQGFGLVYDFVFLLGVGFTVYGLIALLVNMFIFLKSKKTKK